MALKRQAAALETRPARELDLAKQQQIVPTNILTALVSQSPFRRPDTGALGPEAVTVVFLGEPAAKARARVTRRGTAYTPARTRNFERALGFQALATMRGRVPITGPVRLSVEIALPVPKSWSAKKKIDALAGRIRPTGRPDTDNVVKSVSDAIGGIVFLDDAQVVSLVADKVYGASPQVMITVDSIDDSRRST